MLVKIAAGWLDEKTRAIRFPDALTGRTLVLAPIERTGEKSPTHRLAIRLANPQAGPLEPSEMVVPLGGCWEGVSTNGETYYRIPGLFAAGDGVVLRNQFKTADNQPTHVLFFSHETAEERETREAGEDGERRERQRPPAPVQGTTTQGGGTRTPQIAAPCRQGEIHICQEGKWTPVPFSELIVGDITRTQPPTGFSSRQVPNPVIRGAHRCFEITEVYQKRGRGEQKPATEENDFDLTDPFAE